MQKKSKVTLWSVLTGVCAVLLIAALVATFIVAPMYETTINVALNADTYRIIKGDTDEDTNYFTSDFASDEEREAYEAELCGYDEDVDIALLRVAASDLSFETRAQISVVALGDSEELVVGEQVVAIGNALGYGQSVTTGIVSALNRSAGTDTNATYIQTDAAINPGNSGGALLNMEGELIGINTAKVASTDVEGMGYAIPISQVWDFITSLIA